MKRVITILMLTAATVSQAQIPGFGSFGAQNDTVTALYKNGANLFVGAKTLTPVDRAKMYNGTTLSTIGYNPQPLPGIWLSGKEICGIGRSTTGIIAFFDKSSTNYTGAFEYTESTGTWGTNGTNFYNGSVTTVSDHDLSGGGSMVGGFYSTSFRVDGTQHLPAAGKCSVYGAISSTFFDRVTQPWGSTTYYPNDFTFHGGTMYYCTNAPSNNGVWRVAPNVWTTVNIPAVSGFGNVHEIQSFAGDLYLAIRNTANTYDSLFVWDGTTLTGTGISGQINDLEVFTVGATQRLYVAGDKLRSLEFDQVTWTTLIPSFVNGGQITVMESYGTKLALGGWFSEINGNATLSKLAYLEYGNPPLASFTASGASVCDGSSLTFTNSSTGTINTYSWDIQGGTPSTSNAQNPGSVVFNTPGVYTISLTVTNNFGSTTDTEVITVNSLPTAGAGSDQAVCAGTAVTLNGSGASSYSWNNGVTNGVSFNPGSTNTYTVTGTDVNGCVNTDQVVVTVNPLPNVNAGSDQAVCEGTSVSLNGSGASTYTWDNGVSNGVSFTPTSTVTYTVLGTNTNGCVNTDQVTVTVNLNPIPVITQVGIDLTSNYATGNQWYIDASPIGGSQTITPSINGTYTVSVTDNNGCIGTSAPFIVDDLGLSDAEIAQYVTIANGQMTVNIDWSIYDVAGRLVASGNPGKVDMPVGVFILVTDKFAKKILNVTED